LVAIIGRPSSDKSYRDDESVKNIAYEFPLLPYAMFPFIKVASAMGLGIALYGGDLWEQDTRLLPEKRNYIR
jgi:hypothetical protein